MTPTQRNDIAGAIFDFAGFLTAHKEVIAVGSTAEAPPMVSRIQEWAEARGLSLEAPNVMAWNDALAEPAPEPTQRQLETAKRQWESWKGYALELAEKLAKYEGGAPMVLNAAPVREPAQTTCNCRWEGDTQVQECTLHQAHKDAIHDWAERAKTAEAKLAATVREPVAAQQRRRHPQKGMPGWSPWRECEVANRPAWEIDSTGWEVEYRLLYTAAGGTNDRSTN